MWNLKEFKDNIAVLTENGEKITYSKLNQYCTDLVTNIKERCLVFNLCRNEIGSLVGYIGFLNAKIVPLMLKSELEDELLNNLIETYKPSFIWLPSNQVKKYNFENVYSNLNYSLLKTNFKESYKLNEELALLLTTSGSTGSPKLVRQSYKNIESNTKSIIEYLSLNSTERAITTLPMNYTYGISIINTHLLVGASLILTDKG